MGLYQFSHSGEDIGQLLERILDLPQVKHPHIDIVWTLRVHTYDPVTKNVGTRIYAQYDLVLSQYNQILCMDGVPQESRSCHPSDYSQEAPQRHVEERANFH